MRLFLFLLLSTAAGATAEDVSHLKIVPPPGGGIYLGQYEWLPGDVTTFEQAIGRKTAWFSDEGAMEQTPLGPLFDPEAAERAWNAGKVVLVHAFEAYPGPGEVYEGFTVDKLLQGVYDPKLHELAGQFRAFGKPMFFHTAREPLGIGIDYMGGFGPRGDRSLEWAVRRGKGFAEFRPWRFPNPDLYADLGDPTVSDGVERLAAAQRYYHDFFVRREGLDFLTFDTMGWTLITEQDIAADAADWAERFPEVDPAHARQLLESSADFANFYPGDAFVDWVSVNFYMLDYYKEEWGLEADIIVPISTWLALFRDVMRQVRRVAPDKPVFFLEFGLPDGMKKDSAWAATKIRRTFDELLRRYPEVHGISTWSFHPSWRDLFPYDCLIRPGTQQAAAFREVLSAHPGSFESCVFLSNGRQLPACRSTDPGGARCTASPGTGRFCTECGPCDAGQGDCDRDDECAPGLTCAHDVGASFGFAPRVDVCVPAGGSCALPSGNGRFCTECGPCDAGQGDCDRDDECALGLVCAQNVGAQFGFAPGVDVCVAPATCALPAGHGRFCTECGPCDAGQGDCDRDDECALGLVCAQDVGAQFGFAPGVDVCVEP